ncbi:MAG: glycosyltransferase family 4 protein [Candidatus Woesearchaeota archaeon]
MKVLMLGWELPPMYAGGIGMVCYDLLKELSQKNVDVTYLMPFGPEEFHNTSNAKVVIAENQVPQIQNVHIKKVKTLIHAYHSPQEYEETHSTFTKSTLKTTQGKARKQLYGPDLFTEVDLFAKRSFELAHNLEYDVVHAHDWMTFPAATALADAQNKPLILHVHNTIFDRYLGNASQHERDIEYNGLCRADTIIVVSNYVKNILITKYNIPATKIEVVHNAPNTLLKQKALSQKKDLRVDEKIVLFTGRITVQKGPEYFVHTAKAVLEHEPKTKFIMAGSGDMFARTVNLAAELGISKHFLFTGFYTMEQAHALYSRANCFVMPSVSEPFGIVPLEAMDYGTPTIVTRTSGCSEVLTHALKSDFWDIRQTANKVVSILRYPALAETLGEHGQQQVRSMNWGQSADKCVSLYQRHI